MRRVLGGWSARIDTILPVLVAVRWVHFAAMVLLFGGALFWLAAARPAEWPAAARGTWRLAGVAAPVALLSGIGWALASIADMAGDPTSWHDPAVLRAVLLDSPFGPVLVARLVLLGMLAAVVPGRGRARLRLAATAVLAGLLLASQARLGHAAGAGDMPAGVAMMLAYTCHILAAAAWVGGLPPLLMALREAHGQHDKPLLPLLRRVSTLATAAVVVLVAAGAANAAFRLDGPAALTATPYGRVLLAKLGLTAAMLALAAANRRAVLAAWSDGLPVMVATELALGGLVLGAAALLGVSAPPR